MLLQGTSLLKQLRLSEESLPAFKTLPAAPLQLSHVPLTFEEPENREGEAFPRPRALPAKRPMFYQPFPPPPFPQHFQHATTYQQAPPPQQDPLWQQAPFLQPPSHQASPEPRQRAWRLKRAAEEDQERVAMGEPPRKRMTKDSYRYTCKECGQDKNKTTGHTQQKGRWYCPASGQSIGEWKKSLPL